MINNIMSILVFVMMTVFVADRFNMLERFKDKNAAAKYLAISVPKTDDINKTLNDSSKEGWEVVTVYQDKIILKKIASK